MQTDLYNASQDLEKENTTFEEHHASFEEAIIACEEAIRLLNDLVSSHVTSGGNNSGVMLVQLSQRFESIKELLEKHVQKGPNTFIQPIIDVLMELGSKSHLDLEKVQQIVTLIQTLLERLKQGIHDRELSHETAVEDLTQLREHLQSAIGTSTTNVEIYEERLSEIETRQEQLQKLIDDIEDVIDGTKNVLLNTESECRAADSQYNEEQRKRDGQLAVLEKLIQYF